LRGGDLGNAFVCLAEEGRKKFLGRGHASQLYFCTQYR